MKSQGGKEEKQIPQLIIEHCLLDLCNPKRITCGWRANPEPNKNSLKIWEERKEEERSRARERDIYMKEKRVLRTKGNKTGWCLDGGGDGSPNLRENTMMSCEGLVEKRWRPARWKPGPLPDTTAGFDRDEEEASSSAATTVPVSSPSPAAEGRLMLLWD